MTKLAQRHSKLINSQITWHVFNNDMSRVRVELQCYCEAHNYEGELLNAYNKSFGFTDKALANYICGCSPESRQLPKRHAVAFLESF